MVESLKELNLICQKPRYKEVGNWMVRHILRDAALPITWLLLHTHVSANQVTLVSMFIGLFGIVLLAMPSNWLFLAGAFLLQIWYLLDHVDGQLARYHKTTSLTGRFFDYMMHHLIHGVIFFSLGFYAYQTTSVIFYLLWGFAASISIMMFNLMHDAKYKTFFEKLSSLESVSITTGTDKSQTIPISSTESFLRKTFSAMHKLVEIHVVMNTLTFFSLLQLVPIFSGIDFRFILFLFYGVISPAVSIIKIAYVIQTRKIDVEFNTVFKTPKAGSF